MNSSTFVIFWTLAFSSSVWAMFGKKTVQYEEIGEFSVEPPWIGSRRPLPSPQSPEKIKLEFYLMTRNTAEKSIDEWRIVTTDFYKPSLESLNSLDYNSSRDRTAVHVNGMYITDEWNWNIQKRLANAYLVKEDANIIFVKYDGKIFRKQNFYPQLVANIRVVGAIAARFLEQLIELTGLNADQLHIIGFSLGAHTAAYIGKKLKNVYRITGLDPAKPFFEHADPMYRLDHADAQYVDVLHTHTAKFSGLGVKKSIGDVDFYFNHGFVQPGCVENHLKDVLIQNLKLHFKEGINSGYVILTCSHMRVIDYWTESLENSDCLFWGVEKKKRKQNRRREYRCATVGSDTFDLVSSGKYYVPTRSKPPFCIKKYDMRKAVRRRKFFRIKSKNIGPSS